MEKNKDYCDACGHECHCGEKCKQEYTDGDGERYEMQICGNCRHERKKKDQLMSHSMVEAKTYCNNCGQESHCAGILHRKEKEMLLGQIVRERCIEVCKICRCEECHAQNQTRN